MALLRLRGIETAPFLYNPAARAHRLPSMQQTWGEQLVVSYLDPHLGFAHDPRAHPLFGEVPGFVRYGPDDGGPCLRIVALGGSTTDPLTPLFLGDPAAVPESPYCWPKALQENLARRGVRAEVFNGGVAGYTSAQELLKLTRDALPLEPDIVLCLDGVNEVGFGHATPQHPMVHRYQRRVLTQMARQGEFPYLPNAARLLTAGGGTAGRTVEGVSLGMPVQRTAAEQWLANIRASRAVAGEFGADFLVFLQPVLGFGRYDANPVEREWLEERGTEYLRDVEAFYTEARRLSAGLPYGVDLTDAFAATPGCYLDARHQNERGVETLAEAVASVLAERGMLEPRAPTQP